MKIFHKFHQNSSLRIVWESLKVTKRDKRTNCIDQSTFNLCQPFSIPISLQPHTDIIKRQGTKKNIADSIVSNVKKKLEKENSFDVKAKHLMPTTFFISL